MANKHAEKEDDSKKVVVEKKSNDKNNIVQVNTMGSEHKVSSIVTQSGKEITMSEFEKKPDSYTVDGDKLTFKDGQLYRETEGNPTLLIKSVQEQWYPNQDPPAIKI